MKLLHGILIALLGISGIARGEVSAMAPVPAGSYRPLFRATKVTGDIPVASFQLDTRAVTNADFLEFVRSHPNWRRSQVKRLFADEAYLSHWAGDLDLGSADPAQPVTRISWFAAKAFAAAHGKRLPTTDEWEFAARAGFTIADGTKDPEFKKAIARWYATPAPEVLPAADSGRANIHGIRGLHGLVWEWTSDFNSAMMTGDARNDSSVERQLFCGGGANGAGNAGDYPAFMRAGLRSSLKASYTVNNLGFRCAK